MFVFYGSEPSSGARVGETTVPGNTTVLTVKNLSKYSPYLFNISASTVAGEGPSLAITVHTDEDGKIMMLCLHFRQVIRMKRHLPKLWSSDLLIDYMWCTSSFILKFFRLEDSQVMYLFFANPQIP